MGKPQDNQSRKGAWERCCASRLRLCMAYLLPSLLRFPLFPHPKKTDQMSHLCCVCLKLQQQLPVQTAGETLELDTCCLLPMPIRDALEPLATLAPPSTQENPDYMLEASFQQEPSHRSPSVQTAQGTVDKP